MASPMESGSKGGEKKERKNLGRCRRGKTEGKEGLKLKETLVKIGQNMGVGSFGKAFVPPRKIL